MKYKEQQELVADLRMLADFFERPESIVLPRMNITDFQSVSVWGYTDGKYGVDLLKSKLRMKAIVKAIGSCEKKFTDYSLEVYKELNDRVSLRYSTKREAYCARVPTGEKKVIPAMEERVEDVYEWVCEDPSIFR